MARIRCRDRPRDVGFIQGQSEELAADPEIPVKAVLEDAGPLRCFRGERRRSEPFGHFGERPVRGERVALRLHNRDGHVVHTARVDKDVRSVCFPPLRDGVEKADEADSALQVQP